MLPNAAILDPVEVAQLTVNLRPWNLTHLELAPARPSTKADQDVGRSSAADDVTRW
jgi:hypothetical protein